MNIPKDPAMLLSFINMHLRDNYSTLDDLCKSLDINKTDVIASLLKIDYEYDSLSNQFV